MLTYLKNVIPSLPFQFCPMCTSSLVRESIFDDNIPRVIGGKVTGSNEGRAEVIPMDKLPAFSSIRKGSQKAMQYYLSKINDK
jgi:hypothetical protein